MHQADYNAHYSASLGRLYSGCLQQQYSMNSNPYQLWRWVICVLRLAVPFASILVDQSGAVPAGLAMPAHERILQRNHRK